MERPNEVKIKKGFALFRKWWEYSFELYYNKPSMHIRIAKIITKRKRGDKMK